MAIMPRSLTWVLVALCTLGANEGRAADPRLQIIGPVRVPVDAPEKLPSFCRAARNHRLSGCSTFAGQRLTCSCEADGDTWKMAITAQLVPILYFTTGRTAEFHERLHVSDVAERFEAWIASLAGERFDTESKCQERAAVVSAEESVSRHLEMFARQSNSWMQCSRDGERIPAKEAVKREVGSAAEVALAGQQ